MLLGLGSEDEMVTKVLLKMVNCRERRNYMVRAGQHLTGDKFQSSRLKKVFCQIKVLRQTFGVDQLSNYLLKKILAMPEFLSMSHETSGLWRDEELLFRALGSAHLKHFFHRFIDFESYGKDIKGIPLRCYPPKRKNAVAEPGSPLCLLVPKRKNATTESSSPSTLPMDNDEDPELAEDCKQQKVRNKTFPQLKTETDRIKEEIVWDFD